MMSQPQVVKFEDTLEEDDWGLIIGKDGTLKGMFIPEGSDDAEVPEAIIEICKQFFGIDPTEEVTLH
jgi:hypothetical protein